MLCDATKPSTQRRACSKRARERAHVRRRQHTTRALPRVLPLGKAAAKGVCGWGRVRLGAGEAEENAARAAHEEVAAGGAAAGDGVAQLEGGDLLEDGHHRAAALKARELVRVGRVL